jgi:hypothetical protein
MAKNPAALVIGIANYATIGQLPNPVNDADDVGAKLEALGFTVSKAINCTLREMDQALKGFRASLANSEVALFFFAGHGVQIEGENYLVPVDADFGAEDDAKASSFRLNRIIDALDKSNASTKIIILDACRNNPFELAWHRSVAARGLAPVYAPRGTIIAFATSPGQVALDGKSRNGRYTAALLKHIDAPDCSLETMFKRVRNTLSAATKGKQISWEHTSLSGEFFFNLSLGARIDEYSDLALSDRFFVLDESEPSHRIIQELKAHNWYVQNPAIAKITAKLISGASLDSLFVLGRNIYQVACGCSKAAIEYLNGFMTRTSGVKPDHRKAILDGILFEIFFNSRAQLRKEPKDESINHPLEKAFDLQQYKELVDSFAFISECLLPHSEHFHAVPGKHREIAVDVVTQEQPTNKQLIQQVMFDGKNIFWIEDDDISAGQSATSYGQLSLDRFEKRLAEEMCVPRRLLRVTYTFDRRTGPTILLPAGGTTRKPQLSTSQRPTV